MASKTRPNVLVSLGNDLEVWRVHLDDVKEQSKNARVMNPQAFDRLVQTIEKGGRLESLPFCAVDAKGDLHVVSGHHRTRAARVAGVNEIPVLVDVSGLKQSQVIAKQLAHNAIQGEDDKDILSQLYQEMDSLADMLESFIDPVSLKLAPELDSISLQDIKVAFDTKVMTFTFLPSQVDDLTRVCDSIPSNSDLIGVASSEMYDKFTAAIKLLGKECDIRSIGATISKMCDLTLDWIEEQQSIESNVEEKKVDK